MLYLTFPESARSPVPTLVLQVMTPRQSSSDFIYSSKKIYSVQEQQLTIPQDPVLVTRELQKTEKRICCAPEKKGAT